MRWPVGIAAIGLAACSFSGALDLGGGDAAAIDAARPIDAVDAGPTVLGPWAPPTLVFAAPVAALDDDPTLTGDRLEMVFNSTRSGNSDLWVTTRPDLGSAWGTPQLISELSTLGYETTPELTPDGLVMMLSRDFDLYIATRPNRSSAWGSATAVSSLSTAGTEGAGPVTPDLLAIAFARDAGTVTGLDLYTSTRSTPTDAWITPVPLTTLNTIAGEASPHLAEDRLTVWFDSNAVGVDIYEATRTEPDVAFATAVGLDGINDPIAVDADAWMSPDQRHLVFYSDRGGVPAIWESSRVPL